MSCGMIKQILTPQETANNILERQPQSMDNFSFSNTHPANSLNGPSPVQSLALSHSLADSELSSSGSTMNSSRFEERKALRRVREDEMFSRIAIGMDKLTASEDKFSKLLAFRPVKGHGKGKENL